MKEKKYLELIDKLEEIKRETEELKRLMKISEDLSRMNPKDSTEINLKIGNDTVFFDRGSCGRFLKILADICKEGVEAKKNGLALLYAGIAHRINKADKEEREDNNTCKTVIYPEWTAEELLKVEYYIDGLIDFETLEKSLQGRTLNAIRTRATIIRNKRRFLDAKCGSSPDNMELPLDL